MDDSSAANDDNNPSGHSGHSRDSDQGMNDQATSPQSRKSQSPAFDFDVSQVLGRYGSIEADPWYMGDTLSLSDSIHDFPEEYGRTYHAYRAGSYVFPNDAPERDRLILQSKTIKKLMGDRLFFAPLSRSRPPLKILDIATGMGDWAIQMGDMFPASTIIGTDLSPIQPDEVPPNVYFYIEDATDPWEFSYNLDYIHTRSTVGCWESFQTTVAEQAFAALEPGGWCESQEMDSVLCCDDGTLDPNSPLAVFYRDLSIACERMNRPTVLGPTLKAAYEAAGFVDVKELILKMPVGGWPRDPKLKEIGFMWEMNLFDGLSAFSFQLFNKVLDRTPAEIELNLVDVRKQFGDVRVHAYMPVYVVWGRKPFPGEVAGEASVS